MPRWEDKAACKGKTHLFFPRANPTTEAMNICAGCPVIQQCKQTALELQGELDLFGVWAGMTRAERIAITGRHYGGWHSE